MSLRSLLLVLVALNLVAFAGGRMGWLGETGARGEPERLTNQIKPDAIELGARPADNEAPAATPPASRESASVPAAANGPATPALTPPAIELCAAYIVRGQAGLDQAAGLAADTRGRVTLSRRQIVEEPLHWRVRIPPAASREAAEQRLRTLQQRGITDMYVIRGDGPNRWSISLGLFSTEQAANQRLAELRGQGFSNTEILPGSAGRFQIEFRGAPEALETLASEVDDWLGPDARRPCSP